MKRSALLAALLAVTASGADLVPPEAVTLYHLIDTRSVPALAASTLAWDVPFELTPEMTLRYEAALRLVSMGRVESATRLMDQQQWTRQVRDDPRPYFLDGDLMRARGGRLTGSLQRAYARAATLAPDALYGTIHERLEAMGLPPPPRRLPEGEAPTVPPKELRRQLEALALGLACMDRAHQAQFTSLPPEEVRPGPSEDEQNWDLRCAAARAAAQADPQLAGALRNYSAAVPRLPWSFLGDTLEDPRDWFVATLARFAPVEEFPPQRLVALRERARQDPYLAWRLLTRAFEWILVGRGEEAAALARPFVDHENHPLAHLARMVLDELGEAVPLSPELFGELYRYQVKVARRPPPYVITALRSDPSLFQVLWKLLLAPEDEEREEHAARLQAGDLIATFGSWQDRVELLEGSLAKADAPGYIEPKYLRGLYQGINFHGIGTPLEAALGGDIPAAMRSDPARVLEAVRSFAASQPEGFAIQSWRTSDRRQVEVPARLRFPVPLQGLTGAQRSALETMPLVDDAVAAAVRWTWGPPGDEPAAPAETWARALVSVGRPEAALAAARTGATSAAASHLLVGDLLRFSAGEANRKAREAAYGRASRTGGPTYAAVVAVRLQELATP